MEKSYFAFILAAYGLSGLTMLALGLWIVLDARGRARDLAALQAAGARRRSAGESAGGRA